ncbi:MAG TPA: DEAD/DEAH box helicase [Candidatus Olsenella pullicola]|nr:DEAD/DEAH box helicase [Candidatus Olsenella pullicola]
MGVFDRYAPFVQDFIYAHEWESLRGIQVAAGEAIFDTDDHVLLCASTASGKTEAAFFPILTEFWEDPPASVGALYIGPTKALINDQFYRLEELCEEAGIPVWHWHGDVSSSHKAKLMKRPSGILQITPESLEAMLVRRHAAVAKLFCDLRYVVIDEVHALLRQDRGGQCLCLIERLARIAGVQPRRIGLSATIGDPEAVGAFLAAGTGRSTVIPRVEEPPRTWRISMEHFYTSGPQADDSSLQTASGEVEADVVAMEPPETRALSPNSGSIGTEGAPAELCAGIAPSPDETPTLCLQPHILV